MKRVQRVALSVVIALVAPLAAVAVVAKPGKVPDPNPRARVACEKKPGVPGQPRFCVATTLTASTQSALSAGQGQQLVNAFGLGEHFAGRPVLEDGVFRFMHPERFQAVEGTQVSLPEFQRAALGGAAGAALGEENEAITTIDMVDLNAIRDRIAAGSNVLSAADATQRVRNALQQANAVPANAVVNVSNSKMQLARNTDSPLPALPGLGESAELLLDTQVSYEVVLGGIPVRGPGANMTFTLDPEGFVTQAQYAARGLSDGARREIMDPASGPAVCREHLGLAADAGVTAQLVYYAPPLTQNVSAVLPHFECSSSIGAAAPLNVFVPAVVDGPKATMTASATGSTVNAVANVVGGRAPYTYNWTSSATSVDAQPKPGRVTQYSVDPRTSNGTTQETLLLTVTDADGLTAVARRTFPVTTAPVADAAGTHVHETVLAAAQGALRPQVQGHAVSGIEVAAEGGTDSPDCKPYTTGWVNGNGAKGTPTQFHYFADWAWSTDFKADTLSGDDHNYVDDVDMTFYCGHGWPDGITFENPSGPTDKDATYNEVRWGDRDIEWLAMLSCQVLADNYNGSVWNTRWGPAFNGLHELLGFHTNAYASGNLGEALAKHIHGYSIGSYQVPPKKIHESWIQAVKDGQPSGTVWATILPVSTSSQWNRNDFFWNRGDVSADIPASQIYYYVRYSGTV